jgi:hypothetical protein
VHANASKRPTCDYERIARDIRADADAGAVDAEDDDRVQRSARRRAARGGPPPSGGWLIPSAASNNGAPKKRGRSRLWRSCGATSSALLPARVQAKVAESTRRTLARDDTQSSAPPPNSRLLLSRRERVRPSDAVRPGDVTPS